MSALVRTMLIVALAAACGDDGPGNGEPDSGMPPAPDAHVPDFTECEGSGQAFVRQAALATVGRRPLSQDEVNVYTDLLTQVAARDGGGDPTHAQRVVALAMMDSTEFVDRWSQHFMDKLLVDRIDAKHQQACYGARRQSDDDGALAALVRDAPPTTAVGLDFTMQDLVRSSLLLDDLSPVYRGHLFALVNRTFDGANVGAEDLELARRADFGQTFDTAYLHRDILCLGCHNSETSVTFDEDPLLNRHWAMPGFVEKALYDSSLGVADDLAHAVFRFSGFRADVDNGDNGEAPWGWASGCGEFHPSFDSADPAPRAALFGSVRGQDTSVYDLEAALHRGLDSIATSGLTIAADGQIADPDQAFAWLVAATIVEGVWMEVMGTPLTVANYFPRNQAQRDLLQQLTTDFVASRFSLRSLIADIVTSDYFNRTAPSAACGAGPYNMPNVFDPWVIGDDDPARRLNGAGDAVFPLSARVLVGAANAALGWTPTGYAMFPRLSECDQLSCGELGFVCSAFGSCCTEEELYCGGGGTPPDPTAVSVERNFQKGIGIFLKSTEHGFRGLDFQARLEWEDRFGSCEKPGATADFIDDLTTRAQTQGTVLDVVAALKDRLIGVGTVTDPTEIAALEAIYGTPLSTPGNGTTTLEAATRRVCGAMLASPQFLLGGLAPADAQATPLLTPAATAYPAVCADLATRTLVDGLSISCAGGTLTLN